MEEKKIKKLKEVRKTIYENMNINKEIEIILKGSSEIPVAEIISMEKWNLPEVLGNRFEQREEWFRKHKDGELKIIEF